MNIKKIKKRSVILLSFIGALLFGFFIGSYDFSALFENQDNHQERVTRQETAVECPERFASKQGKEYTDAVAEWINSFQEQHPEATKEEVLKGWVLFLQRNNCESSFPKQARKGQEYLFTDEEVEALMEVEAQRPPGISENPTQEEIAQNPFIQHISTALDNYLNGIDEGVEVADAFILGEYICGLDNFNKDYYGSSFSVHDAGRFDMGGVWAHITFDEYPSEAFWAWVYKYIEGGYTLRMFCKVDESVPGRSNEV